jgi:Hydrolytic ATP binding site of dynein motor region
LAILKNLLGLRAIKSVLDCAIKHRFSASGEPEEMIIYKAIQSVSSAKYMSQDILIYNVSVPLLIVKTINMQNSKFPEHISESIYRTKREGN